MSARTRAERGIYHCVLPVPYATGPAPVLAERYQVSAGAKAAWLRLRDDGGFWTAGELGRAMHPELDALIAAQKAGRWLSALARRGHVAKNPRDVTRSSYGVTGRCTPPHGLSIHPALDLSH